MLPLLRESRSIGCIPRVVFLSLSVLLVGVWGGDGAGVMSLLAVPTSPDGTSESSGVEATLAAACQKRDRPRAGRRRSGILAEHEIPADRRIAAAEGLLDAPRGRRAGFFLALARPHLLGAGIRRRC